MEILANNLNKGLRVLLAEGVSKGARLREACKMPNATPTPLLSWGLVLSFLPEGEKISRCGFKAGLGQALGWGRCGR